jgi:hypothetical protein
LGVMGLSLVAGCSTQARRVSCDERLVPINVARPVVVPAMQVSPAAARPGVR